MLGGGGFANAKYPTVFGGTPLGPPPWGDPPLGGSPPAGPYSLRLFKIVRVPWRRGTTTAAWNSTVRAAHGVTSRILISLLNLVERESFGKQHQTIASIIEG